MTITRRGFLGAAAAVAGFARLSEAATLTADGFLEIRAARTKLGLLEGGAGETQAWILGQGPEPPTIRARQGMELKLRFINDLDREIWLHFFGVRGPSELMTINVRPGADEAVDCVFTPPDAGTFWIGPVAEQSLMRDMGLCAVLVVEEAEPLPDLGDIVLVLDDWKLDPAGAVEGAFGDVEAMVGEGRLGNWFTVNNRFRPRLPLAAGSYTRLRILNAANVRTMNLLFKGYDPLLLARDGQPVKPASLQGKALSLAPGQRADLLASAEEGDIRLALDLFEDVVEIGYLVVQERQHEPPALPENFALPANPTTTPVSPGTARTVSLTLAGGIRGGLTSALLEGREQDLRALLERGKGWAINGVAGPSPEPAFSAAKGETLRLEIDNRTAFPQPLHIHGHVWKDLRADAPSGLSDTVVIPPRETVALAFTADNPGLWALHSLVAERADGGLITSFSVEDEGGSPPT
ncbi:multicopper oxidase family protein [Aestuariivirga sp.]|uniref:multicopper oxidase family protein n=1 Tax=Aestuariivirga sp. TaxID=2650926 RepID=UPI00391D98BE